ncbi:MAG: aldolase catalytic domain-containing protein [Pseudomonadota bacterium]
MPLKFVDCTLRDGGYYNDWNFSAELISDYLEAMATIQVDFVEIGFRTLKNQGFKGGCAFSTDGFLNSLPIPEQLRDRIGVMVNGAELVPPSPDDAEHQVTVLEKLFAPASDSPVSLVRIACHVHEFQACLPAADWLKARGYLVGFNLMQVSDRSDEEISGLAKLAAEHPLDVLYFADSLGSLAPEEVEHIGAQIQKEWTGELGIHTHDNMGQAIANSQRAAQTGITWLDSTVTGMGRGPGNAQTEYLMLAIPELQARKPNPTKLLRLIRRHFDPLKADYKWGKNPYYFLAGQYGIHPTYVQQMLSDPRYSEEDILAVLEYLRKEGGKTFSVGSIEGAREFYSGEPRGSWEPSSLIGNRPVLILGTGPSVYSHRDGIEQFIRQQQPFVLALNTQADIEMDLIDARAACHPVRLLADCHEHLQLPQPLITPESMLPNEVQAALQDKELLDFGLGISRGQFAFEATRCFLPNSLVLAYALAVATSGGASSIYLAGFDGFGDGDPRNTEVESIFECYSQNAQAIELLFLTPSRYHVNKASVYGLIS